MARPLDKITGPITREELPSLAAAPHGHAAEAIRVHDPFWGRGEGEKIRWKVCVRSTGNGGTAYVDAASREEADKLADELDSTMIDWDDDEFEVLSVEPDMDHRLKKPAPIGSE